MTVKGKSLLILAGGVYQLPLIREARRRGLYVTLFDGDPGAPGFQISDAGEVVDIADPQAVITAARRVLPIGVASIVNEVSVRTAAAAAAALGLPGIGVDAAAVCTDKVLMRTQFERAGIPCPRFGAVRQAADAMKVAASIGFPVVVKPVDNSGSRGVRRVDGFEGLEIATEFALSQSRKGEAIIEGFLDGTEYTVETFTANGQTEVLGFSEKVRLPFPHCVSISLTYGTYADFPMGPAIVDAAKQAIVAAGLMNGPGHIEVMLTESGPVVVELAARGGGYRIFSEILSGISGVDPIAAVIDQALGLVPRIQPTVRKAAVLRFFNPPESGTLRSVTGVSEARQIENVLDVVVEAEIGQPFRGITRDGERPGYVIAIADTREQALLAADQAERLVVFAIESDMSTTDAPGTLRSSPAIGEKGDSL